MEDRLIDSKWKTVEGQRMDSYLSMAASMKTTRSSLFTASTKNADSKIDKDGQIIIKRRTWEKDREQMTGANMP